MLMQDTYFSEKVKKKKNSSPINRQVTKKVLGEKLGVFFVFSSCVDIACDFGSKVHGLRLSVLKVHC